MSGRSHQIYKQFIEFHKANPHVYAALEAYLRAALAAL